MTRRSIQLAIGPGMSLAEISTLHGILVCVGHRILDAKDLFFGFSSLGLEILDESHIYQWILIMFIHPKI